MALIALKYTEPFPASRLKAASDKWMLGASSDYLIIKTYFERRIDRVKVLERMLVHLLVERYDWM